MNEEEIDKAILALLRGKGAWGKKYIPFDTLKRWIAKKVGRNGRRVQKRIDKLLDERWILIPKKKFISLNPSRSREILEILGF